MAWGASAVAPPTRTGELSLNIAFVLAIIRSRVQAIQAAPEVRPSAPNDEDDARLVTAALSGDRPALERLCDTLLPVIHTHVARVVLRWSSAARGRPLRQEIEDLIQEAVVALLANDGRALRAWRPGAGMGLRGFVGLVAEREVSSILRSGRRSPWSDDPTPMDAIDGPAPSTGPEEQVATREVLDQVLLRLHSTLSPLGRMLFERLFVAEESVETVCEATGMSADAVYAWRSRLRKAIAAIAKEVVG